MPSSDEKAAQRERQGMAPTIEFRHKWPFRGITTAPVMVHDWCIGKARPAADLPRTYFVQMPARSVSMIAIENHIPCVLWGLSALAVALKLHSPNAAECPPVQTQETGHQR
jgi:hypothetical protein